MYLSLIHFEFIFVSGIQPFHSFTFFCLYCCSIFILLYVNIPFYIKEITFSPLSILAYFVKYY